MSTDTERREVAARLRDLPTDMYEVEELWEMKGLDTCCKDQTDYYLIHFVLFECFPVDHMHQCDYEELHMRLADLIDPDTTTNTTKTAPDTTKCNREALLALADEMEFDGAGALDDEDWCKPLLVEYARRIREALGVTDD